MNQSIRIFESKQKDGVILCFDADCSCTTNLLVEVEKIFENQKVPSCSIHFEHPCEERWSGDIYQGIIQYELHLRYYVDALKYAQFPKIWQTYHYQLFEYLKIFITAVDELYQCRSDEPCWSTFPATVQTFVTLDEFEQKIAEINNHSTHLNLFKKDFFNGLMGSKC